ncbi:MAG: type II toxin-antitoxin system Phd/YefM family antitoxin [Candidatus Sulfotelmatobacter sp.]
MKTVTVTDAKEQLDALLESAQQSPVVIQRQDRDVAILMSVKEYDRIRGTNVEELDRFCERISKQAAERGLTDEILADLLKD